MKIIQNKYSNHDYLEFMPLRHDLMQEIYPYGSEVITCFFRLLFHYWFKNCEGLKDDDEMLKRVAFCGDAEWSKVKSSIFGNESMFVMDADGLWQNPATKEQCEKIYTAIKKRQAATASARVARLSKFDSAKSSAAIKAAKLQKKNA